MVLFTSKYRGGIYVTVLIFLLLAIITTASAGEVPYGIGSWDKVSLGNHRAVIHISEKADAVWVHIPWRRRDYNPEKKDIIIIDAKTGNRLKNIYRIEINREYGDLVFQPETIPGDYYVYYMQSKESLGWGSYPDFVYPEPEKFISNFDKFIISSWLKHNGLTKDELSKGKWRSFPRAQVVEIQAIDEFNSFYPMEVIATAKEISDLIVARPESPYLLFPEDRTYPIRMRDNLPFKWIKTGPQNIFMGEALRGEYYAFQIGVYASRESIEDIDLYFGDLKLSGGGAAIPASGMNCINLGGTDVKGKRFEKTVPVEKGKVRPLWIGIQVPQDLPAGKYEGVITVAPKGMQEEQITITLDVKNEVLKDAGDSEPWRYSRLRWLDSTIAVDDDIVEPFTPMEVNDKTISCLGRTVTLGNSGLPVSIQSMFAPEMTYIGDEGREILSHPVEFVVEMPKNKKLSWVTDGLNFVKKATGKVVWESRSRAGALTMDCHAEMEFDGHIEYTVTVSVSKPTEVNDIRLEIPVSRDAAKYFMGMGLDGGYRPSQHLWKWDEHMLQDAAWIGDVNAGLQCKFKGENYACILGKYYRAYAYYPDIPFINLPPAWYNDGKGGCAFFETDDSTFLARAYSGHRKIEPGEKLCFNFTLIVTPLKTLNPKKHFNTRYFHNYRPVEEVLKVGANTINIHHGREVNPYINYPFLRVKELKDYVDKAHDKGLKVKLYYTLRELSNHTVELWALKSLNHEVFPPGRGGGYPWLQEHFGSDYIPAWVTRRTKCAAIGTGGNSRWHNYYIESLNWLVKNVEIDGIYIDATDFDRHVMKRIRKVLKRARKDTLIDFHTCSYSHDERFGFASCANLHIENFPYMDSIWFGEYYDFNSSPDYWLVEISGIPFGLMGEMLVVRRGEHGGTPWRGMVYGMVNRRSLPTNIWRLWDEFGIQESKMIGYWSPSCPVKTNHDDVLATAYVNKGKTLVSVASWAKEPVNCRLLVDWDALGLNQDKTKISAPAIPGIQDKVTFKQSDEIPIQPGQGWLLILSE